MRADQCRSQILPIISSSIFRYLWVLAVDTHVMESGVPISIRHDNVVGPVTR